MSRSVVWSVLAALFLLAAPGAAQSLAQELEYTRAAARVQAALAQDAQLRAHPLLVQRTGNVIVLTGAVPVDAARTRAEEVARDAAMGATVRNQIEVSAQARRRAVPLPPRITEAPRRDPEPATEAPQRTEEPVAEQQPTQPEAVFHTVRRGDTLIAIARQHGTTVSEVQRLNDLRGTSIRAGQRLRVR